MPYKSGVRPVAVLWKQAMRKYGKSLVWYLAQLYFQEGLCAICRKPESRIKNRYGRGVVFRLSVDHCHNTGIVRGLLCSRCNKMLGYMEAPDAGRALAYRDAFANAPSAMACPTVTGAKEEA